MIAREGFAPQAYWARYKWVHLNNIQLMGENQWEYYIKESYRLVVNKLPAKVKKQLGEVSN